MLKEQAKLNTIWGRLGNHCIAARIFLIKNREQPAPRSRATPGAVLAIAPSATVAIPAGAADHEALMARV